MRNEVRRIASAAIDSLRDVSGGRAKGRQDFTAQQSETPDERARRVVHIRLCPRRLLMYVGEQSTLAPLPLDSHRQPVHGVAFAWESSDSTVADVGSDGSVLALHSGRCTITASVANKRERVQVEVRDGARPVLSSSEWEAEHAHDCDDPESAAAASQTGAAAQAGTKVGSQHDGIRPMVSTDPDDPPNITAAAKPANFVGQPRFSPLVAAEGSKLSKQNQLGSSSYSLDIPIFGSGGRGVGVGLSLVYNSRVWTKDEGTNKMVFDYDQGWPAPGFRLNYGRIIPNYDVPAGFPGNYLLIEADGTRTPLIAQGGTIYRSDDGRFIEYDTTSKGLGYPDGTVVFYDFVGTKLVPETIRDINGNSIDITYIYSCADALRVEACTCGSGCVRPPRQAINYITDTLGRTVTFYYKADGNLAEIRVPGYNLGTDRTLVKFYYQPLTLSYNFGSMTVTNAPPSNQLDMLQRVYFPDTGRGYVFDYSGYGMCTHVSMRLGMTDSGQGTEVAYSEYSYNQTGALSDSPEFNQRKEWWQGKTDDLGNVQDSTNPAVYTYGRTTNHSDVWMIAPNQVKAESFTYGNPSSSLYGLVSQDKVVTGGGATILQHDYTYNDRTSTTGLQRTVVVTTDDGSPANQTRTVSTYGSYGRLMDVLEQGFPINSNFKPRRETVYAYVDDQAYLDLYLRRLVKDVQVFDNKATNDTSDDELVSHTAYTYDAPDTGFEIVTYGYTHNCSPSSQPPCNLLPGYKTKFADRVQRGNVTKLQQWSSASGQPISFNRQYDIFGNLIKAEVGCCSLKQAAFSYTPMYYSAPDSATDGPAGVPNLTTQYGYDFNTSFVKSVTDPNSLITSYTPDAAMRVQTVSYPSGATLDTRYNDQAYTKDGLAYRSTLTYMDGTDGTIQRVQIGQQWLDGAGRVVRSGSAAGPTVTSYDVVKSIYDEMGRLRKTTNPYNTTNTDGDTTGLPYPTVYDYDSFGRVIQVTLPDSNTVSTSYNGAVTTVTDPAGRQRSSEVDGLGRVIKVTEVQLGYQTLYGYDINNNLTSVDQGGQTRAYKYDMLSRLIYERTPEQDATISAAGGSWSASYTYKDFGGLDTKHDARGVVTSYGYDGLNRLTTITYTTTGTSAEATPNVTISYGSAAPELGRVKEVKQTDASSNTPWKESYAYDAQSRLSSKTVAFDNQTHGYTTSYLYNQANQLTRLTYPSSRAVEPTYDSRGRLAGLAGTKSYVTSVGYSAAQQVTSLSLGNGVTESYGYSADRLQLTSQSAVKGASTLLNMTYSYVAAKSRSGVTGSALVNTGQLMDITAAQVGSLSRAESYSYDSVGRLTQASGSGWYSQRTYTYDRWGNRTGVSGGASQTVALQPQAGGPSGVPNNRILSVNNGPAYQYDAAGEVTNDGAHSYTYDAESRLVKVDNGSTAVNSYDAANRRVKKVWAVGQVSYTTYYVWEGDGVIAEYSTAPQVTGGTRYYHADRLSNRVISDSAGAVKGTMDNLPYGEEGGVSGESEKHRYTGYERDAEAGSDYAVNRQYSFTTGRFNRPDSIRGSLLAPQSLNRYSYSRNDPINFVDPLGLMTCFIDGIEQDCSIAGLLIRAGAFNSAALIGNGFSYIVDKSSFYRWIPGPDGPLVDPRTGEEYLLLGSIVFDQAGYNAAVEEVGRILSNQPFLIGGLDSWPPPTWRPGENPRTLMRPPETVRPSPPRVPGPPADPTAGTKPTTGNPQFPTDPMVDPNNPMPPQNPSFWWRTKFFLTQVGRALLKSDHVDGLVYVGPHPCIFFRDCDKYQEGPIY
ncbi:MAG TPA: RHS repeat-associated core domain-containing protein [Blastocatellia bacterium]|nr:RHS repeat-associated core domain-containing protein [Blastocatellia bacterium]